MPLSFRKPESLVSLRFGAITAPPWGQGGACDAPCDGPSPRRARRPQRTDGSGGCRRCWRQGARARRPAESRPPLIAEATPLACAPHADPPAERPHGAHGAPGRDRRAHVLAKGDEQVVVADPVTRGQLGPERHLGLLRRPRSHVAETVRDPVHVGVDTDPRLAVSHRDDQVGGLPPDAFQREEIVDLVGDAPAEAPDDVPDRYLSEMDSRSFRARGRSFAAQSAATVGAVSSITRWSSRRASAERPVAMYRRARSIRSTVNFGSITRPFLKCASALAGSPPKSRGTSMSTLPASEWARTERGSSCSRISISSRTVGRRKRERSTPLVWPQRPVLIAYQRWASWFRGASSTARFPSSRPRA